MIDLQLSSLSDKNNIVVLPYEYSVEELIDMIMEQNDCMMVSEFEHFCDEILTGIDAFENALTVNAYIEAHGVDQSIVELIGNESVISGIKDAIVSFAKWLWEKLTALFNWILKLFGKDKASTADTPAAIASRVVKGSKEQRKSEIAKLRKLAKSSSSEALTSTEAHKPEYYFHNQIDVHCKPKMLKDVLKIVAQLFDNFRSDGVSALSTLTGSIDDPIKDVNNAKQKFSKALDWFKDARSAQPGQYMMLRNEAIDFVDFISDKTWTIRSVSNILVHEFDNLPKPSDTLDEDSATKYVETICSKFNIKNDVLDNKNALRTIKLWILGLRGLFTLGYQCDAIVLPIVQHIVTSLYNEHNPKEDLLSSRDNGRLYQRSMFLDGAVDVQAPIPNDLMQRMQSAWGTSDFKIKRIVITNSRNTKQFHSDGSISGLARTAKIFTNGTTTRAGITTEIMINYGYFKSVLRFKDNRHAYAAGLKETNISAELNNIDVKSDRVQELFNTIIHECRHVWQSWYKKYRNDESKKADSYKEYLDLEHERDARKAAIEFKATPADREWIIGLLKKCLRQEYASIRRSEDIDFAND